AVGSYVVRAPEGFTPCRLHTSNEDFATMGFDIAIGIVLLLGAIRGFKKGFARQILTISSIVIAFVFAKTLAERLASPLAKFLQDYPDQISESIVYTGSLLGIFLTINLVGTLYL